MPSEMTKNRRNCCATAVSARPRGTLRTFVGKYPDMATLEGGAEIGRFWDVSRGGEGGSCDGGTDHENGAVSDRLLSAGRGGLLLASLSEASF
jgi:hypothetical protein